MLHKPLVRKQLTLIQELAGLQEVYLVGGAVRDTLLGKPFLDIDFAVSAEAINLARSFAQAAHGTFILLDQENDTARVVVRNEFSYDFSGFRGASLEADLKLRDFSINAMALKLSDLLDDGKITLDKIIDPLNGRQHLTDRVIQTAGETSFIDDPLRVLRAFRFAGNLCFTIHPETCDMISKYAPLLERVAAERITYELHRFLNSPDTVELITLMRTTHVIKQILPGLDVTEQSDFPEQSWNTALATIKSIEAELTTRTNYYELFQKFDATFSDTIHSELWLLKLAALFSAFVFETDTELPLNESLKESTEQRLHLSKLMSKKLKLSNNELRFIKSILCNGKLLLQLYNSQNDTPLAPLHVFRLFRDTFPDTLSLLFLTACGMQAQMATRTYNSDSKRFYCFLESILQHYKVHVEPQLNQPWMLTGSDLKQMGMKPGPHFGAALEFLRESMITGRVTSRDEAVETVRQFIDSLK